MSQDVDMATAAALLGRSYSWFSRNWRTLTHPATLATFPQPFVGAELRGRPRWRRAAIEAWKDGAPSPGAETRGDPAQRAANDAAPLPRTDRVDALVAFAGG